MEKNIRTPRRKITHEEVREFNNRFLVYCDQKEIFQKTFLHFLRDYEIIRVQNSYIAESGIERFSNYSIIDTQKFEEYWTLHNLAQYLTNQEKTVELAKQILKDEIDVSIMF